jgi:3-hydroxyisobutyrate dehydrogenase-like beta-hydroxyacid dehydrogenase
MQNGLGYISAIATVEILGLCIHLGMEPESFIEIVRECGGIGNSAYFERISHHLVQGTDAGDSPISIPAKDVELLVTVSKEAGLPLPLLQQCAWYFGEAVRRGWQDEDVARIGKVLEASAGTRLFGSPSGVNTTESARGGA